MAARLRFTLAEATRSANAGRRARRVSRLRTLSAGWGGGETGRFLAASVSFILNYACYFSEIIGGTNR
jgi:hypothetical protein